MTSAVLATGRNAYVSAAIDHCAQDCIAAVSMSRSATRLEAAEPLRMAA